MPPCDWDHSFPVNVWKLHCCSLPWCLALTSLYFLSAPKNEYCSCLPHLHCGGSPSAAFTSWAPGIAIPFPLSPLPAPDLSDGRRPNTTPLAVSPAQENLSSSENLSCCRQVPWAFPATFVPISWICYIWNVPWKEEWSSSQMIAVADCSVC